MAELAERTSEEVDSQDCRRRAVRRWVRFSGQIVRATDFTLLAREVIDLSEDGLRAIAEEPVALGDRVLVVLKVYASTTWIEREGMVVHVADDGSIGVSFDAIDVVERARLASELRRLPPVVPRRESGSFERVVYF